jgi:hypothetical protein
MRMPRSIVLAPGILGLFLPDGTIEGRTWRVSPNGAADFTTIQDGVHAAADGDSVLVEPGIYHEDVTFVGRQIVLMSTGGPAATIIDAANEDSAAVNLFRSEPPGTVLQGFTIRNGRGTSPVPDRRYAQGGGINVTTASVTIRGNIVEDCEAMFGGGVQVGDPYGLFNPPLPQVLVEDNVIRRNYSSFNAGGVNIDDSNTLIRRNRIEQNESKYDGGGLQVFYSSGTIEVSENLFLDNIAGDKGGGLRVACSVLSGCGPLTVSRNIVARNEARGMDDPDGQIGSGGGISIHRGPITVTGNTIVRNRALSTLPCSGGGVLLTDSRAPATSLTNNIIAFNNDCGVGCRVSGTAFSDRNIVWGHELGDVGNSEYRCEGQTQGGIIRMDPLICNLDGEDFAVSSNSPALAGGMTIGANPNAGCNDVPVAPSTWGWIKAKLLRSRD